ncbi:hypothetical protein BHF71_08490 [Vulcanibacillus modesticaldus]|uniref:Uncharacterized protein n=1 Tax=Vulcanibacillus modesticaldus TaxID=337097 RepID=A0A1D2YVC7_9BACI|nr:Imm74 family immunity protein [Vulcanibacillus modesticaldus]OEF99575.1 hypothetical protein BHF71_08490 [Vulcanibacillus modesticaldus]
MKITGTSSYIEVEIDNKTVKIQGEMIVNGFVAYSDTIIHWEPPHEHLTIDSATKDRIIKKITEYSKKTNFKIVFE